MREHSLGRANRRKVSQAMSGASAPPKLPPLPDLPTLTSMLRRLNSVQDGPGSIMLALVHSGYPDAHWVMGTLDDRGYPHVDHFEELPGDGKPFDAVAAARRLLAEARLAGFR